MPLLLARNEAPAPPAEIMDLGKFRMERSPRVLVAEDNPINQKVASRLLERMGHRVDGASNGVEAVQAIRSFPYEIVLMDVQLPDLDSLQATRLIRQI